jgi:hypothetical protein
MLIRKSICPICKSSVSDFAPVVISPWIRKLGVLGFVSSYFQCRNCNTGFFSKRYNQLEMKKIYGNYRGLVYVKIRSDWEPWYSGSYNKEHNSEVYVKSRKASLSKFLMKRVSTSLVTVIDVGGGAGEFIPDLAVNKIVLEVSDKDPIPGVIRFASLNECPQASLIIFSHVLEHVAEPQKELEQLFEKTNLLYVEVPFGVPEINSHRKNPVNFFMHLLSSFSKQAWRIQTEPATGRILSRQRMLTQSEHITFFTEKSIETLAAKLGAEVQVERNTIITPDNKEGTVLQCLFTKSQI